METSPEQFESLQKLLKLKRYEHPHPRYFNDFSARVIARIEAGEARAARPWWEKFGIDMRALATVGAGAAACVALFVSMAGTPEAANARSKTLSVSAPSVATASIAAPQDAFSQPEAQNVTAANSTDPVFNAAGVMRIDPWNMRAVRASYQTP
jgi:hypothetical protein